MPARPVPIPLFVVIRYRDGLARGAGPEEATVAALTTAGKSVLFAGTTIVIALLGLFVMQVQFIDAIAVAASLAVFTTMVASITLLPALLGFTDRNIDRFKVPARGPRSRLLPGSEPSSTPSWSCCRPTAAYASPE